MANYVNDAGLKTFWTDTLSTISTYLGTNTNYTSGTLHPRVDSIEVDIAYLKTELPKI